MKTKPLLSIAMVSAMLVSTPIFAVDTSCDIELDGHIQYYQGLLTVDMDNGTTMTIDKTHQLLVNGDTISLNNEQQQWVSTYYSNIDTAIPMTLDIANEGLKVASIAVSEVFSELLGDDHALTEDFDAMFISLNEKLDASFYDDNGNIKVDSSEFDESNWIDEAWEEEIESLISESMGRILIAIGTEMLWSGGDMDEFEHKMEAFGEDIESRIEAQTAALEVKGDALCKVLQQADYAENKMQSAIPGLDGLNVINMHNSDMKM